MTEFLIAGRGTGKTTTAINWVHGGPDRRLVSFNEPAAENARRMDRSRPGAPLHRDHVMSYSQVANGRSLGLAHGTELAVDDLEQMLHMIFGYPVGLVTATGRPPLLHRNRFESEDIV